MQSGGKVKGGLGDLLYSARGAKPEDDFVLSDSDEERGKTRVKLGNSRSHTSSATSSRGSSCKSVHAGSNSRTNILLPEKGESLPVQSQTVQQYNSASNNHSQLQPGSGLKYNSANYVTTTNPSQAKVPPSQLSRLSRKSLREVSSLKLKFPSKSTSEVRNNCFFLFLYFCFFVKMLRWEGVVHMTLFMDSVTGEKIRGSYGMCGM